MTMIAPATKSFQLLPRGVRIKLASRNLTGRAPAMARPLGDVNDAMKTLDLSGVEIIQLLQNGDLSGFNIATDPAGFPRYRVLTHSLDHFKEYGGHQRLALNWNEIWKLIFNDATYSQFLTGVQIQRALNCTHPHVANLAPNFIVIRQARRGRGNTATFTTASVEAWLKGRLL